MEVDIIIALANDQRFNYAELRYTLRSIEKNLSGYRDIYLIGEKPSWITNVIHIPQKDIRGRTAFSIFSKFMTAANNENVSQKFISWADDTYLLKPLLVEGIKDWYDQTLKDWTYRNINSLYRNIIRNTWKIFPDGLFYNVHTPCIYDKDKFKALNKYDWKTTEYLIKSLYFNHNESDPVPMRDPKRHRDLFLSTSGKIDVEINKIFKELFSKPSRYEADNKTISNAASSMAQTSG